MTPIQERSLFTALFAAELKRQDEIKIDYYRNLQIPEGVHPHAVLTIHDWINRALNAINHSDYAEAERLRKMILDKIELERTARA
jgi:hypothetical protein